jgi:ferric-dicitrate binding protein FerR (iron transport regulator)
MDKSLLQKFIKGECTAQEAAQVQQWINEHPALLDAWLHDLWNEDITEPMPLAMEAAILQEAANMPGYQQAATSKTIRNRRLYWSAAAAIVMGITGWWLLGKTTGKQKARLMAHVLTITAPAGKAYRYMLPDQSTVWLKANARLQLDTQAYNKPLRAVQLLTGEAFFEVQKNPQHPFIVQDGLVQTRVLGTSFNVQTASADGSVVVTVATGKVQVSESKKFLTVLLPGKQISVQPKTGTFSETNVPLWMASLWKEDEIQLTNVPFTELAMAMEKIYGISLQTTSTSVKKKNYNIRLSKNSSVQEVIQVLALLNHNQFKKLNNSTYLIY